MVFGYANRRNAGTAEYCLPALGETVVFGYSNRRNPTKPNKLGLCPHPAFPLLDVLARRRARTPYLARAGGGIRRRVRSKATEYYVQHRVRVGCERR